MPTDAMAARQREEMAMQLPSRTNVRARWPRAAWWGRIGGLALLGALAAGPSWAADTRAPSGRVVMAWHVTISPSWFDPSTAPPQITPFGMLYAIHDALV